MFYINFCLFVVFGHVFSAVFLYLTHRFIFHNKKVKNIFFLSKLRRMHLDHHKYTFTNRSKDFLKTPLWGTLMLLTTFLIFGILIHPGFGVGMLTFAGLYSKRHYAIHNHDTSSKFHHHHMAHHRFPKYNFSGVYPVIDEIFNTSL
ncbi:MAG: sterol desaturase family protein [Promethearchaeota archaeon]